MPFFTGKCRVDVALNIFFPDFAGENCYFILLLKYLKINVHAFLHVAYMNHKVDLHKLYIKLILNIYRKFELKSYRRIIKSRVVSLVRFGYLIYRSVASIRCEYSHSLAERVITRTMRMQLPRSQITAAAIPQGGPIQDPHTRICGGNPKPRRNPFTGPLELFTGFVYAR